MIPCATTPWQPSTTAAWPAAIAAKWPMRRFSARPSIARRAAQCTRLDAPVEKIPYADHFRPAIPARSRPCPVRPESDMTAADRPISIAILALGGQGGGVLADWIVATAEANGWYAQSTSVPGVAQRTGATLYYIETMPSRSGKVRCWRSCPRPAMSTSSSRAELMEAGRAMLRGLVTPDRTTLITSAQRAYAAVAEKERPGEGIGDPKRYLRRRSRSPAASSLRISTHWRETPAL